MSVVGIDLGTLNSVIAVARNRGVDVVSDALLSACLSRDC
jgi:molecular chaperone DnaK (HSP70)